MDNKPVFDSQQFRGSKSHIEVRIKAEIIFKSGLDRACWLL